MVAFIIPRCLLRRLEQATAQGPQSNLLLYIAYLRVPPYFEHLLGISILYDRELPEVKAKFQEAKSLRLEHLSSWRERERGGK
jgi:hypothetical protein